MMADRRRINGPQTAAPPVFTTPQELPIHHRTPEELRQIFLKTSLTPPATGSAFLELSAPSTLKLTASVYGPRPLPPSAPFSPNARVTAELKFAPFSTFGVRRGFVRDALERDLSSQLCTALTASVKASAYPKSGIDVFVTVLDCEGEIGEGLGAMQALAGAITCASTALADAGVECVDLVSAGMAAKIKDEDGKDVVRLDPSPLQGGEVSASVLVGYMAAREEMTLCWMRGEAEGTELLELVEAATRVARRIRAMVNEAVKEKVVLAIERRKELDKAKEKGKGKEVDTAMSG